MVTVAAVVLAAGRGERIGGPKLFLKIGRATFLERIILELEGAGIGDITVVVSSESKRKAQALVKKHRLIVNKHPANGMVSSLHAGIKATPGYDGYLIAPVDHPFVAGATYSRLVMAFHGRPQAVIRPSHQGKTGHPIIIPKGFAGSIPPNDFEGGVARLLHLANAEELILEVEDAAVLRNVNQPKDLLA
jgi:molybdenum cofactor cytidylyltransferase